MNGRIEELPRRGLETFVIHEAMLPSGLGMLDPITVIMRDLKGKGQIVVECYGDAWSTFFGGLGKDTLREFIAGASQDYLANRFVSSTVRTVSKRERAYVEHIARAVIEAVKCRIDHG